MKLMEMDNEIMRRLDRAFLVGDAGVDFEDLVKDFEREVDLAEVSEVVREAMSRFEREEAAQADAWVGPRLHAALRLTRREAARRGIWRYLAVVAFPEYVR